MHHLQHHVDLTTIQGDGDFPCPGCGANISPDDQTENTYRMIKTQFHDGDLSEVVIACQFCQSIIHISGFEKVEVTW